MNKADWGVFFTPPGWRVYCLGFGTGLVVGASQLALGQIDTATVYGVAVFFSTTIGSWLGINTSVFLVETFAKYLRGLQSRLLGLNIPASAAMENTPRRKRPGITKYLVTIPLYIFPGSLVRGGEHSTRSRFAVRSRRPEFLPSADSSYSQRHRGRRMFGCHRNLVRCPGMAIKESPQSFGSVGVWRCCPANSIGLGDCQDKQVLGIFDGQSPRLTLLTPFRAGGLAD